MSLKKYKQKRSFKKTPEPTGGKAKDGQLHFVVQKHAASQLHYDFRLEMKGVLKSWAVPKGPSIDPTVKRLAMMVEDHPYDYKDFEGTIPEGHYGAGTVIVWDEGTYEPAKNGSNNKKEIEKSLLQHLKKGKLHFTLHGHKLKGEFALVKASRGEENAWLLMKIKDKYAKKADITKKEKSVVSGKTIKQVEKISNKIWNSNKTPGKKISVKKTITKTSKKKLNKPNAGKKQRMPANLSPMLATLVDKPFDDPDWIYEIKWDGYRALAYVNKEKVELRSRNNKSFTERFYPIHDALQKLKLNAILDGEIIVLGQKGVSKFGDLQNWRSEADGELKFYVFDVLWLNGYNVMNLSLLERCELLIDLIPDDPVIQISQVFETSGKEFFDAAKKLGLEGIITKKTDSLYTPGIRSKEWVKIKISKRHEVVIGGFTYRTGSPKLFSSLLVGVYKGKKLNYTGKIGTGFNVKQQKEMMQKFKKLITKKSPFEIEPDVNKLSRFRPNPPNTTVTWLKPQLVCEVSYTELTNDGVMRHPSFEGMRTDKKAKDVVEEKAKSTKKIIKKKTPDRNRGNN